VQSSGSVSEHEPSGIQHARQSSAGGGKLIDRVVMVLTRLETVAVTVTTLRIVLAPGASVASHNDVQ